MNGEDSESKGVTCYPNSYYVPEMLLVFIVNYTFPKSSYVGQVSQQYFKRRK